MDQKHIEELAEDYKVQLQNLDKKGLQLIADNRSEAEEYARRGIRTVEPENFSEEYAQTVANEMQVIARMILEERVDK